MNKKTNDKIKEIKNSGRIGFMGHVIAGFPDFSSSLQAAMGICEGGSDFLEIQFPFSDPTADGPTIEGACYKALENGFKIKDGFKLIEELNKKSDTIILIMTYANIIFKYGIENFVEKSVDAGASGLIIPDVPIERDEGLNEIASKNRIDNILIATPGDSAERIRELSKAGSGFLYTVARRGITGKKSEFNKEAKEWFELVKNNSTLPIAVGFGIRTKEQIRQLKDYCDIAIMGSHLVNIINDAYQNKKDIKNELKLTVENLLN